MSQVTAIQLLAVLSTVVVVPVLSDCSRDGPADCDFEDVDVCNWSVSGDWYIYWYDFNYYLSFVGQDTGRVWSRLACSTGRSTHCLKFQYWFEVDNVDDLNIIINSSETGENKVWTMSSSGYSFDNAQIPIKIGDNFSVIIEVERHNGQNHNTWEVAVDRIRYEKQRCRFYPSSARPATTTTASTTPSATSTTITTTTTTTATTSETTTSTTTTQTTATTHFDQGGASGQTPATREVHTESTSPATTPVTADQAASSQSQDDVATIVGAVVGVLVFTVVAVVVLLVLRRKQLLFWKTKADKQRGEHFDVTASHNAAYNLDLGDQGETSDVKMTAIDTEHHSPPLDATAPSHSSDDYYNINTPHKDATTEPPNQMYAAVNKPRRPNPTTANTTHQQATPLPSDQMYAAVNKPRRSKPSSQPKVTDRTEDSPYDIASDTPDCTAHQPAGDAAAGLYHCLEDDPETQPQLDTTDPYLAPDTLDTDTYSLAQHLYDVPPGARTTASDPTHPAQQSQHPPLKSQDEDGDYNTLNLGGRRPVEDCGEGEGEGPGHVYSGLNEGDGDTYSEVNHHRRREVIDDQYSRFQ